MTVKVIMSVDVDHFPGGEIGVKRILDIFKDRNILGTFFVAGKFAQEYEECIKKIHFMGHEIGCHGYSHGLDVSENFIDLDAAEQKKRIQKSSEILKGITGSDIMIFRAPYAKISHITLNILESLDYQCDSSVSSLRFDFGLGTANNMKAFFAPTHPYHPSIHNIFSRGNSMILEVPVSAFFVPLTLSGIRTFGVNRMLHIFNMSLRFFDPIVFYLHPYEVMAMDEIQLWHGLPRRHKKNRGDTALFGLQEFIDTIKNKCEFIQFKDVLEAD